MRYTCCYTLILFSICITGCTRVGFGAFSSNTALNTAYQKSKESVQALKEAHYSSSELCNLWFSGKGAYDTVATANLRQAIKDIFYNSPYIYDILAGNFRIGMNYKEFDCVKVRYLTYVIASSHIYASHYMETWKMVTWYDEYGWPHGTKYVHFQDGIIYGIDSY